jgi:hypothetical protein
MSHMNERLPPKLDTFSPLTEIGTTRRFATFKGTYENQPVFIKTAVDPTLKGDLVLEAVGLTNMKELDNFETLYKVPSIIAVSPDYIMTEWALGRPMKDDFESGNMEMVDTWLSYLVDLYVFIDGKSNGTLGATRFNRPDRKSNVEQALDNLESLNFRDYMDSVMIDRMAAYIPTIIPTTETRFTNGDLQPSNLLVSEEGVPTVVDCESCSWLWPRHYNIVNFIFNYGARYPEMIKKFKDMLHQYCMKLEIDPYASKDAFNISAAMRCLQMVEERLAAQSYSQGQNNQFTPRIRTYIESSMARIATGNLFVE